MGDIPKFLTKGHYHNHKFVEEGCEQVNVNTGSGI